MKIMCEFTARFCWMNNYRGGNETMSLKIKSIALTVLTGVLFSCGIVFAQDDFGGEAPAGTDTSGPPGQIVFEGSTDASLFVGFYRLNPGDLILVEIITDRTQSHWAMLDDEGFIVIPVLGRIVVAGLTLSETRELLQAHVDEYFQRAWVSCRLQQMGKVKFYVYGDVQQPGFYTANSATTFFDFLQTFGLVSGAAHRRIVHVQSEFGTTLPEPKNLVSDEYEPSNRLIEEALRYFESGEPEKINPKVTIIDPLSFTLEGEIEQKNFYLRYGDVIYVPDPKVTVQVSGFARSGLIEVLPGESWLDIM
ncbi:MAG TPA: hypothetical protein ENN67_01905, partial [Firmicutes bacterium]|nr:hypothetical protein [Bacillota bacterium]